MITMITMETLDILKVGTSLGEDKCLNFFPITTEAARIIRSVVEAKKHPEAGAILLEYIEAGPNSWVLIEFWQQDYHNFVVHLQQELNKRMDINSISYRLTQTPQIPDRW